MNRANRVHICKAGRIKRIGNFWCKQVIHIVGVKLRQRSNQRAAVMPQPGGVLVSPLSIKANIHKNKYTDRALICLFSF
jgi:hypothetical protein